MGHHRELLPLETYEKDRKPVAETTPPFKSLNVFPYPCTRTLSLLIVCQL